MGPRQRLNQLQAHANAVMSDSQHVLSTTDKRLELLVKAVMVLLETATDAIEEAKRELLDGVTGEVEIAGKVLPCKFRLNLLEGDEED
jgi:hypothetical protein